jgi:hypothetical protein
MKRIFPPAGAARVSYQGEQITVPEKGIDLPDHIANLLIETHGMLDKDPSLKDEGKVVERIVTKEVAKPDSTDPDEDISDDINAMKRGELLASLKAMNVKVQLPKTNDELKAMLRTAINDRAAAEATKAGAPEWKEYVPDPAKSDEENAAAKAEHDKTKPAEQQ